MEEETADDHQTRLSCCCPRVVHSLDLETGSNPSPSPPDEEETWLRVMLLAFQSVGVIYGDIGTSPLYVYSTIFRDGIKDKNDVLGVMSLIIYTIIFIPMIKYVFIVLWANDNGEGGTLALYMKICRHANISLTNSRLGDGEKLSDYEVEVSSCGRRSQMIKRKLESSRFAKIFLFVCAILGTSMAIGDGILTPSISVLSAVGGIKGLHGDSVVYMAIMILILLFSVQRFGTEKVGYTFAPAIILWLVFVGGIGMYNLFKYDVSVLRAFNPKYMIDYFKRNSKNGWMSLGGVVLCVTGTEAMYAGLSHFSVHAIQISFSTIVFPAIALAYIGQGAYLAKFPEHVSNTFYASIPDQIYWPTFVIAVIAAIIASQGMISSTFAIVSHTLCIGCFPRMRVVHTSSKYGGQIYIPEINYFLMIACVAVTLVFKTTANIGNAYGVAVVGVMMLTTFMAALIMLLIWKISIWLILSFFLVFISIELIFFSSVIFKFVEGGYLPLAFSMLLMTMMGLWHYVYGQRYSYELKHKFSDDYFHDLAKDVTINRLPGIGLILSEMVHGVPPILSHFVRNMHSIHSVTVLVSIKSLPVSKVSADERFTFQQVEDRVFKCIIRYGYKDVIKETDKFEMQLVEKLKSFVLGEKEVEFVQRAMDQGVFYLMGEVEVVAVEDSCLLRKLMINRVYNLLHRNFRKADEVFAIPRDRLLRVAMTYEI